MYVLLGNQGHVALFKKKNRDNPFKLTKTFENSKFIQKESNIYTHRAGTNATSYTTDQTTLGENHYKNELTLKFCKSIVKHLEEVTKDEDATPLIVIGSPSLVGALRKKASKRLNTLIKDEVTKNFYTEKSHELESFFNNHHLEFIN